MPRSLDQTDWKIIDELQEDGRLSFNQLGKRVNLSPPAVAERVRRLEESGVITGYRATIDPAQVGMSLTAFVELRCETGHCFLRTTAAQEFPEVTEIHKLSGASCTLLKLRATSMAHLEGVMERIGESRNLTSHIVLSTQYERKKVDPPSAPLPVTQSDGWR